MSSAISKMTFVVSSIKRGCVLIRGWFDITDSFATPEGALTAAIPYRNTVAQHGSGLGLCCATALRYSFVVPDLRDALRAAASRYRDTAADHEKARMAAIEAVLS